MISCGPGAGTNFPVTGEAHSGGGLVAEPTPWQSNGE